MHLIVFLSRLAVRLAIRAFGAGFFVDCDFSDYRSYSRARVYYRFPYRTSVGPPKFAMGEETLCGFQTALPAVWQMDGLGYAAAAAQGTARRFRAPLFW